MNATRNRQGSRFYDGDDDTDSHFAGSVNSQTETTTDNPGPGRILGKLYGFVGRRIENGLGMVAMHMGYGPRATVVKIRRLRGNNTNTKKRKLESAGSRLVRYVK